MESLKLVVFDMDDTLITNNTWLSFNTALGVSEDDDYALYSQYVNGEIDYTQWLEKLVTLYQLEQNRFTAEYIQATLTNFTLAPGAKEAVMHCKNAGLGTAIITGSFHQTADAVATRLGIDTVIANTACVFDDTNILIDIETAGDEALTKPQHLITLVRDRAIQPTEVLVVGDGANDIPLFALTGNGVTFSHANEKTQASAAFVIDSLSDLDIVLQRFQ